MTVLTGTATDHGDLYNQIVSAMIAEGWTQIQERASTDTLWDGLVSIMQGPSVSVGDTTVNPIIAVDRFEYFSYDHPCIRFHAMKTFEARPELDVYEELDVQLGASRATRTSGGILPVWASTMQYWIVVNARRVIVVAKVSTSYQSVYAGFFNQYGTASEHPYPYYLAGATGVTARSFSLTGYWLGTPANPNEFAAYIMKTDGVWSYISNFAVTEAYSAQQLSYTSNGGVVFPYAMNQTNYLGQSTPDGNKALYPCSLHGRFFGEGSFGELDGLFCVVGAELSSEDTIQYGGDEYMVVQAGSRIGFSDFMAVRLT